MIKRQGERWQKIDNDVYTGGYIMEKESSKLNLVADLSNDEINAIKNFLQGAVFCWCKNCTEKNGEQRWFNLRDLIGEASPISWKDAPLIKLYEWHKEYNDYDYRSSMDAGKILRSLIHSNKRFFHEEKNGVWQYKLTDER